MDIKYARHKEALSGVKASRARLMTEAEARRKKKPQELATKKMQSMLEKTSGTELETASKDFKIDYKTAAKDALNSVQQKLAPRKVEQKVKLELENKRTQEQLSAFDASVVEETKAPSSLSMKLNVICGQTFGMMPQGITMMPQGGASGNQ